jgi:hypothetical protein
VATPTPPRTTIALRISSQPPGAAVYRVSDGVQLGTTPFVQTLEPVSGIMRFVLKMSSYEDAAVDLPTDRDGARDVILRPQPPRLMRSRAGAVDEPAKPHAPVKRHAPAAKIDLDDPFND